MINENSRYHNMPIRTAQTRTGQTVAHVGLRYLPLPEAHSIAGYARVEAKTRLDHLAHTAYGDPTQFWRIADASLTMEPENLTRDVGRRLPIPLIGGSL